MSAISATPDRPDEKRLVLFKELYGFFESYALLTGQLKKAADDEKVELISNLINLRFQLTAQVDKFEKQNPDLLGKKLQEELDPKIIKTRQKIISLMETIKITDDGLVEVFANLKEKDQKQAGVVARGKKVMKGYNDAMLDKKARLIETSK